MEGAFGYKTAKHTYGRFDFDFFGGGGGLLAVTEIEYLGRSLNQRAYDVGRAAGEALESIMRHGAAKGNLGSGNTLHQFANVALNALNAGFTDAATFTFNLVATNEEPALGQLKFFGVRIVDLISAQLTERSTQLGLSDHDVAPWLTRTKIALQERKDRLVDDFEHGMHGSERLKKDNVVNAVINQSNSPGAVAQVGAGTFSQTVFTQQQHQLIEVIDQTLSSQEFLALNPDQQQGFRDIADVVKAEAARPTPDTGKLQRWGKTLVTFSTDVGLKVASSTIAQVLLKIFGA
ncbi:hypothetical protein [Afipia sp. DC4300-2b1]|uniref:hypothetical protein n=1 Tax=Afipia sp. DC4300-2b1 TaxID=2804672 RepID=UPI003CFB2390